MIPDLGRDGIEEDLKAEHIGFIHFRAVTGWLWRDSCEFRPEVLRLQRRLAVTAELEPLHNPRSAEMADYIPSSDPDFNGFATTLISVIQGDMADYGVSPPEMVPLTAALIA
ncbi:MAG: hypothetical protein AABP62_31220 [Planctomycetota bacterium]